MHETRVHYYAALQIYCLGIGETRWQMPAHLLDSMKYVSSPMSEKRQEFKSTLGPASAGFMRNLSEVGGLKWCVDTTDRVPASFPATRSAWTASQTRGVHLSFEASFLFELSRL